MSAQTLRFVSRAVKFAFIEASEPRQSSNWLFYYLSDTQLIGIFCSPWRCFSSVMTFEKYYNCNDTGPADGLRRSRVRVLVLTKFFSALEISVKDYSCHLNLEYSFIHV